MDKIMGTVQKHHDWAVEMRNHFHQYPELSGREYETQAKIIQELAAFGLQVQKTAETGLVTELRGSLPGRTIAIRADMDALPIQDACGKPYASKNSGICHACGHDGHMAVLLGTIRTLLDLKDELCGTYRFIFQPSEEEFPSGAAKIASEGFLDGVDAIIGAHLWQSLTLGTIGISYGNLMAAPDKFLITIRGKGGHGSMPHQTVDPTLIAAQIIMALHTVTGRNIDPLDPAVLSIGALHTGNTFNIIPDTATIEGTVRSFNDHVRKEIFARIEEIVQGICAANRATYELDTLFGHPAVTNHAECAEAVKTAAEQCQSGLAAKIIPPVMCGEDFSYYLKEVPGTFFFIGTGSENCPYPHHHPKFDLEERSILHGIEIMTRTAINLAEK